MRVTMLAAISGTRNGVTWPPVGGEIDVPDAEAADLITAYLAVAGVTAEEVATIAPLPEEAAALAPLPERATKTVTRAKLRGK